MIGSVSASQKDQFTVGNIFETDPLEILSSITDNKSLNITHLFGPGMSERLSGAACHNNNYCQACAASRHRSDDISSRMYDAALALA